MPQASASTFKESKLDCGIFSILGLILMALAKFIQIPNEGNSVFMMAFATLTQLTILTNYSDDGAQAKKKQ